MTRMRRHLIFATILASILLISGFTKLALGLALLTAWKYRQWKGCIIQKNWDLITQDADPYKQSVNIDSPKLKRSLLQLYRLREKSIESMPLLAEDFVSLTKELWKALSLVSRQKAENLVNDLVMAWPTQTELNYNPVTIYGNVPELEVQYLKTRRSVDMWKRAQKRANEL